MTDRIFKRFLYTGVGLVATAAEQVQKQVNEVVERANVSEKEGERIVNDFVEDLRVQRDKMDGQWKEMIDKALERFEFTSYEEVESLKNRVAQLSEQVEEENHKK
ncbi:MAG: phasin family protein [Saprospiraceae bacterium]